MTPAPKEIEKMQRNNGILAKAFLEQENTRIVVFEDFPKWYLEVDVFETSHAVDIEDYFLRIPKLPCLNRIFQIRKLKT